MNCKAGNTELSACSCEIGLKLMYAQCHLVLHCLVLTRHICQLSSTLAVRHVHIRVARISAAWGGCTHICHNMWRHFEVSHIKTTEQTC